MLLNDIYYLVKPAIPWRIRLAVRRRLANSRRTAFADVWPIDERAGVTPPNWPGWPEGKQFAVVLTHDVEGLKGLQRVPQLMEVDRKHGFRSTFNFVPKGEYSVPAELRHRLEGLGFEVGVHGFEHDGKLYRSKARFSEKAPAIRECLREWNASGFRSPLMQHRLTWLHELGLEYDASTFDTDPFEPESDGVRTIFPFWVPGAQGKGYVEIPYTLPQDFTLFVVLREPTIDIWKKKLDWVAGHGGMAVLNVHPDYIAFEGKCERDEYPLSHYEEFLDYLKDRYQGQYWPALLKDVSRFYCSSIPAERRNTRRNVGMVTHSVYESDNRVRRYAETLAKRGDLVEVFAISQRRGQADTGYVCGVTVHRLQHRKRNEESKWTYAFQLLRFLITSSAHLTRHHRRSRYDMVHIHSTPDFLVFGAWYPKWTGARLILDILDRVPEGSRSKFPSQRNGGSLKALRLAEKLSTRFVDHVIVANHLLQNGLVGRSAPDEQCKRDYLDLVDSLLTETFSDLELKAKTRTARIQTKFAAPQVAQGVTDFTLRYNGSTKGEGDSRPSPSKESICIIVENMAVPPDRRVWREARALKEAGYAVSVICPKRQGFEASYEELEGIEVYRHAALEGSSPLGWLLEYPLALAAEFRLALKVYARHRFKILQACNPPDNIFLIALFFKLFGVRFIFDQHDPVPEFFEARFQGRGFFYRVTRLAERLSFQIADAAVVTNDTCRELAVTRGGVAPESCFVVRNCPSLQDFPPRLALAELKLGKKYLVVYVGIMGSQDGIDLLLDSIDYLVNQEGRKDTLFVLIGGGSESQEMKARTMARGLDDWVRFTGPLYGEDLKIYLATADLGVSPDPFNLFNNKLTMIKILEYMACGLPTVLYDLAEGRRSAADSALYARRNDSIDFARQIAALLDSEALRRRLGEIGRRRIQEGLNWENEKRVLVRAYEAALGVRTQAAGVGNPSPLESSLPSHGAIDVPRFSAGKAGDNRANAAKAQAMNE